MNWEINQAESQYYCSTFHMCIVHSEAFFLPPPPPPPPP
jgi:hypothetical protein